MTSPFSGDKKMGTDLFFRKINPSPFFIIVITLNLVLRDKNSRDISSSSVGTENYCPSLSGLLGVHGVNDQAD
ncbi:hypothetical protein [Pseudomonas sp. TWP3-1]|uniref:hypothetical protein n=1 Tax=Pseudomonas sp. TWP3-1 TaxID=2804631 RepID=UPI003CF1B1BF